MQTKHGEGKCDNVRKRGESVWHDAIEPGRGAEMQSKMREVGLRIPDGLSGATGGKAQMQVVG